MTLRPVEEDSSARPIHEGEAVAEGLGNRVREVGIGDGGISHVEVRAGQLARRLPLGLGLDLVLPHHGEGVKTL
jgi:hypothetical protein